MKTSNRWAIAIAGVFLQIALGAVYAWSVFRVPLSKQFGWSISEVTLTFTISIFVLGFAAFFGGLWMTRKGPRVVALTGAFLYGLGVFLANFPRTNSGGSILVTDSSEDSGSVSATSFRWRCW